MRFESSIMVQLIRRSIFHFSRTLLCGLLAFLLAQGQWLLLQGVAWTDMVQDNSRGKTLLERAESTFSGTQPCPLCLTVSQGLHGDAAGEDAPKAPQPPEDLRLIFALLEAETQPRPSLDDLTFARSGPMPASAPADPPALPPPRFG